MANTLILNAKYYDNMIHIQIKILYFCILYLINHVSTKAPNDIPMDFLVDQQRHQNCEIIRKVLNNKLYLSFSYSGHARKKSNIFYVITDIENSLNI